MALLLRLLKPDLVYANVLRENPNLDGYTGADREEVNFLRAEFSRQSQELLPTDSPTLDALEKRADSAYKYWETATKRLGLAKAPANVESQVATRRQAFEDRANSVQAVYDWAAFTRMHYRVVKGCNKALILGFLALIAIGFFAWAVGQKKDTPPQIFVVQQPSAPSPSQPTSAPVAALPALGPILFETGDAVLSGGSMTELAKARDYLRGHPDTGVLALAYTETRGGRAVNRALAARRANAVRSALIAEGGIAASRIFVAELPETDLPTLTGRDVDSQTNRSMQLMLLALPLPGR
jgi:outer membrane protein OmpA-like peptidoglycan-associated protein